MKDFEPSKDFVARVMGDVRNWEAGRQARPSLRWLLPAGSALLWLFTMARIFLSMFAPAVCR